MPLRTYSVLDHHLMEAWLESKGPLPRLYARDESVRVHRVESWHGDCYEFEVHAVATLKGGFVYREGSSPPTRPISYSVGASVW